MLNSIFQGIFDTTAYASLNTGGFLLCLIVSLAVGALLALVHAKTAATTKSFLTTLAILPAVVCMVIMMVNGNIGAGVAVAGAFGLVRFRSQPGTAREIGALFIAMGAGLATGMGYLAYAILFVLILVAAEFILNHLSLEKMSCSVLEKTLSITIPEDLDYTGVFDDLFEQFTTQADLISAKTTNMGSLFKLKYDITFKENVHEKDLIDALRCRNGNLEVSLTRRETARGEL